MTDLNQLSDRDLLITLNTKVDDLKAGASDHEARIRTLEAKQQVAAGAASGRMGLFDLFNRSGSTLWALLMVGTIIFAWFH